MSPILWLVTVVIRAFLTALVVVAVFGAPVWAGVLAFVIVSESATPRERPVR